MLIATTPLETFVFLSSLNKNKEWINQTWVSHMPGDFLHSLIVKRLFLQLLALEQQNLGEVYQETAFVVMHGTDHVEASYIPDLQYTTEERLTWYREKYPDWRIKPLLLVPDIVVEVVSPNDQYVEILKKIDLYNEHFVRRVWLVEPQTQTITIHSMGNSQQRIYRLGDSITDDAFLPGLSISLAALFGE